VNLKVDLADFFKSDCYSKLGTNKWVCGVYRKSTTQRTDARAKNTPKWARNWGNCTMVGL